MVVIVSAVDVVENSSSSRSSRSSSSDRGDRSGVGATAAAAAVAVAATAATAAAVNNNHSDQEQKRKSEAEKQAADQEEQVTQVTQEDRRQDLEQVENIQNNNATMSETGGSSDALKEAASTPTATIVPTKSAVSQRNVDIKIEKTSNMEAATQQLSKKVLKLDLGGKNLDEYSLKSPKSPIAARLPHQTSLTSSVDVEDRKTLREALYQGIFHRHRRTIFAVGSFLRMLRSRNSQYNTIRSSSEGEDIDEILKRRGSKLLRLQHLFER